MTKKEIRRLENLLTVKVDALAAWILLKELCEILGQGDRDHVTVEVLKLISQDLYDNLDREGLICDEGITERLIKYVELTNPPHLRLVK